MTDAEVIEQCMSGDLQIFRVLVERYHGKIVGMAYNMTRDHHLSEDLCQDVFLDVYRHLDRFDPARALFSTWLYRIAQNKVLNALKRKRPVFMRDVPETTGASDVRRDIELAELHSRLDRALDQLPDNQRIAFVWAEIEQLSYQQIADIEAISVAAVKSRINRARRAIQAALQDRMQPYEQS